MCLSSADGTLLTAAAAHVAPAASLAVLLALEIEAVAIVMLYFGGVSLCA